MAMNKKNAELWENLKELHQALRDETKSKYRRINPFYEDLFDWKERSEYWLGEDKDVTLYNSATVIGDVDIGVKTWIGPFCALDGTGGLKIGDYCALAMGCQLITHDTVRWALSGGKADYEYAPVRIGNCCFLGTYTSVLKGVTVGDHCLIGAGSVITKDVSDYSIVAGVPARRIGTVCVSEDGEIHLDYMKRPKINVMGDVVAIRK